MRDGEYPGSLSILVWAEQQKCGTPLEKLILFYLADRACGTARCTLRWQALAEWCCAPVQQCQDAVDDLERRALIYGLSHDEDSIEVAMPWWRSDSGKAIWRPTRTQFPHDVRQTLFCAQDGKCWYCATCLLDGPTPHIEHQIPVSRGGEDTVANVVLACATCNISKGAKTVAEFREHVIRRDRLHKSYRFFGEIPE